MDLSPSQIFNGVAWYLVFVFSTCLHEAAHAWAALRLGDPTAYHGGQVTLNPAPHIKREPIGMVVVPLIMLATRGYVIGWASAPYDPMWAIRYPKRSALMAAAGPASNLLLVILSGLVLRAGAHWDIFAVTGGAMDGIAGTEHPGGAAALATIVWIFFNLNLLLFTFNLIPLPPLDGSGIVPLFLSENAASQYMQLIRNPGLSLLGLFLAWKLFPPVFDHVQVFAVRLLFFGAG